MSGKTYTRDQLRTKMEDEAAGLDPEQWLFGEFEFDEWLSDSLASGHVKRA